MRKRQHYIKSGTSCCVFFTKHY